jgi:hypothetical protein
MTRPWRSTFGLVALVASLFALGTLIIGVVAYEVTHEALEIQLDHRVAIETRALIDEGDDGPTGVAMAIRRREAARSTASLEYLLVDPVGRRVAGSLDATAPTVPGYLEFLHYRRDSEHRIAQALTTRLPDNSRLVVAADRGVIDEMDATLLKLFAGAFGVMLLLGIGGAWLVGAVTRARLAHIDRTALAIIDGDLARRMPLTGAGDEFDRVGDAQPDARPDRRTDGQPAPGVERRSPRPAHPLTRLHNRLDEALSARDVDEKRQAIEAAAAQSRELLDIFEHCCALRRWKHCHLAPIFRTWRWINWLRNWSTPTAPIWKQAAICSSQR